MDFRNHFKGVILGFQISLSLVNLKIITVWIPNDFMYEGRPSRRAKKKSCQRHDSFSLGKRSSLTQCVVIPMNRQEFTDTSFHYSSDEPEIPFHPGLLSVKTTQDFVLLFFFLFFSILFCV